MTGALLPLPLQFLAAWIAVWLGRVLQEQVDYLKAENRLLREKLGTKQVRLTDLERRKLAIAWRPTATIVAISRICVRFAHAKQSASCRNQWGFSCLGPFGPFAGPFHGHFRTRPQAPFNRRTALLLVGPALRDRGGASGRRFFRLVPGATIKWYLIVRSRRMQQVRRTVQHCKLETILAVGYRARSHGVTADSLAYRTAGSQSLVGKARKHGRSSFGCHGFSVFFFVGRHLATVSIPYLAARRTREA
jgi:hypothetical protein